MADNVVKVAIPLVTLIAGHILSVIDSPLAFFILLLFYVVEFLSLIIESILLSPKFLSYLLRQSRLNLKREVLNLPAEFNIVLSLLKFLKTLS